MEMGSAPRERESRHRNLVKLHNHRSAEPSRREYSREITQSADQLNTSTCPPAVCPLSPPRSSRSATHTLPQGRGAMANDGHYYNTPNAPKAKGTPAGVAATTPRSLSNYPTSLRTSLYANNSPATAAAGTYSSRVPLVAQLHATAPPSPRTSLTTRVHAQAGRDPSRSTSSTATTTTRRRQPRTSNPFEELSAPAFDSFIDTITSTLRAVLEPPAPPSTSSEERKRRERERQERERLREVARLEREQRKRGEDVFGQVVAVGDAAASAAAAGQEVDDDEEEDGRVEVEGEPARLCVGFLLFPILTPRIPSLYLSSLTHPLLFAGPTPPLLRSTSQSAQSIQR